MYGVRAFARAGLLGAIMCNFCVSAASGEIEIEIDDVKTAIHFSGTDFWRHGLFSYGGLLWSPAGLDREGFTLKTLLGGGRYSYVSGNLGNAIVVAKQNVAFVLPGWRFQNNRLTMSIFAGLDAQYHRLSPDDPSASLHGLDFGIRGSIDLWFQPTPNAMMTADASASSIGPSYSARLALGWRIADNFYLGPEIGGFAHSNTYNQIRLGLHVTGLKIRDLEWSTGMGWTFDSDDRDGVYGRLAVFVRK